jgi:methionyl-tRNA synthetase
VTAPSSPLDIRCAVVRQAVPHPNADKLYVLTLDVGSAGPRTVVAGVRPFYRPEELEGRRVALLANLEPRTIRKMTSQGMVLAADSGDRAVLLTPPDATAPGTALAGTRPDAPSIRYEDFERSPMVVGRVVSDPIGGKVEVDVGGQTVTMVGSLPAGTAVVVRLPSSAEDEGEILTFGADGPLAPDPSLAPGIRVR